LEIHFEKLRNRVDAAGAMPLEARLETLDADGRTSICWSCSDIKPPMLMRAVELFGEGLTVREVAATLRISKSEARRLRIRAIADGLLSPADEAVLVTIGSRSNDLGQLLNPFCHRPRFLGFLNFFWALGTF
jgi:hypothetical protein